MKQILQNTKSGELRLAEVPAPALKRGGVLVRTEASVISSGTERYIMDFARKNYLGKARARPDLVRQVLQKAASDGVASTYQAVMSRLDVESALGYSCSGRVIEVDSEVTDLRVGEAVACAGMGYASHAEINFVPRNLVARVPEALEPDQAAYATVGSIALQGVRVLELTLGESVVVVGLGLIGLLAIQIVEANGGRAIGIDLDPAKLEMARRLGCSRVVSRDDDVAQAVLSWTRGVGADAVLVTAAASTNDPLLLAIEVSRKRARIGVVGNVPLEVPQKPFYEKELQLRMSTSYGPGRYDPVYEEGGVDYPLAYVRWTENRNLEAFLDLVSDGRVDVKTMTTHRFSIDEVDEAYAVIEGKRPDAGAPLGVIFEYPTDQADGSERPAPPREQTIAPTEGTAGIALIGAGTFARGVLLPIMKRDAASQLVAVVTSTGQGGEQARKSYGFQYASTDYREVLDDAAIDIATIVTPHAAHARMVSDALRAQKHVFVEKPLCINAEELADIREAWSGVERVLHVGLNRRFAPHVRAIAEHFAEVREPLVLVYRVNAGYVPPDDWVHRQGGRIIGEGCHFIDTLVALTGSRVRRLGVATVHSDHANLVDRDSVSITLQFEAGHLGTVHYLARGSGIVPKERLEVHGGERSAVLDDFRRLELFDGGSRRKLRSMRQDKGHAEQWKRFMAAVRDGGAPPVPFEDLAHVTELSILATEAALDDGGWVDID